MYPVLKVDILCSDAVGALVVREKTLTVIQPVTRNKNTAFSLLILIFWLLCFELV